METSLSRNCNCPSARDSLLHRIALLRDIRCAASRRTSRRNGHGVVSRLRCLFRSNIPRRGTEHNKYRRMHRCGTVGNVVPHRAIPF